MTLSLSWFDKLRENQNLGRVTPPLTKYRQRCCCERNQQRRRETTMIHNPARSLGAAILSCFAEHQSGLLLPQRARLSYRVLGLGHTEFTASSQSDWLEVWWDLRDGNLAVLDSILLPVWKLVTPTGYGPSGIGLLIPLTQETAVELSKVQGYPGGT